MALPQGRPHFCSPGCPSASKIDKDPPRSQIPSLDPALNHPESLPLPSEGTEVPIRPKTLPPHAPLFTNDFYQYNKVINTFIRGALKKILIHRNTPLKGHGFHNFGCSETTLTFDNNVQLQDISSSVCSYLENASRAPSIIPSTCTNLIHSTF